MTGDARVLGLDHLHEMAGRPILIGIRDYYMQREFIRIEELCHASYNASCSREAADMELSIVQWIYDTLACIETTTVVKRAYAHSAQEPYHQLDPVAGFKDWCADHELANKVNLRNEYGDEGPPTLNTDFLIYS